MLSLDFSHAYMRVGVDADQLEFATILLRGPAGVPHMATLGTQPFGRRRAPANWARVIVFSQLVIDRLFDICMGVFVGDCIFVDPEGAIAPAPPSAKAVWKLLGLHLDVATAHPPCREMELLGARVAILGDCVCAARTPRKVDDYAAPHRKFMDRW